MGAELNGGFEKTVGGENAGAKADPALSGLQKAGDILDAAGLRTDFHNASFDTTQSGDAPAKFVGTRVGTTGSSQVSAGAGGLSASYERQALAGAYAERRGQMEGKYGTASYEATAKAEAAAKFSADGKLNLNGLSANVNAHAGLTAEAVITGTATTKPLNLAGVPFTAGLEATAKLSANVGADASGQIQVTRYPPTAIVQGSLGASAVVKAEGEFHAHLGPVGLSGTGYVSAGTEATMSGVAGYDNGILRLGGGFGAAAGVGAGESLEIDVNAGQIAQALKHVAANASRYNCFGDPGRYVLD